MADQLTYKEMKHKLKALEKEAVEWGKIGKALREREQKYRTIVESAQDHIFIIDVDYRVEYANAFAAKHVNCNPKKILGKHLEDIFPPELADSFKINLKKVFESGEPLYVEDEITFEEEKRWLGEE